MANLNVTNLIKLETTSLEITYSSKEEAAYHGRD